MLNDCGLTSSMHSTAPQGEEVQVCPLLLVSADGLFSSQTAEERLASVKRTRRGPPPQDPAQVLADTGGQWALALCAPTANEGKTLLGVRCGSEPARQAGRPCGS